ncbi:MAG: hypothetical protein H0U57_03160 [Tatlockia sp.]|nr:hypothetical protein [Tatlockia sp.]
MHTMAVKAIIIARVGIIARVITIVKLANVNVGKSIKTGNKFLIPLRRYQVPPAAMVY